MGFEDGAAGVEWLAFKGSIPECCDFVQAKSGCAE